MTKACGGCALVKPHADFNKNKSQRDGLQTRCRACQIKGNRDSSERHPETRRLSAKRMKPRKRNSSGQKRSAHNAAQRAAKAGRLIRPSECSSCGVSGQHIHAHHDDYSRPLDVQWLCPRCHGRLHTTRRVA